MMVNGRRRDHGADRAKLQLFSVAGNGLANCQVFFPPPKLYFEISTASFFTVSYIQLKRAKSCAVHAAADILVV